MSRNVIFVDYIRGADEIFVEDECKKLNDARDQYNRQISEAYIRPNAVSSTQVGPGVASNAADKNYASVTDRPKPVMDRSGLPFSGQDAANAYHAMRKQLEKAYMGNG